MNFSTVSVKQGRYTLPDHITPIKTWKNGYSAEETMKFRKEYSYLHLMDADDIGAFAAVNQGDIQKSALIRRKGPVRRLEYNLMPQVGKVIAETPLGKKPLEDVIDDERARFRGFLVVHKGKIVYEQYPAMRDDVPQIWASAAKVVPALHIAMLEEERLIDLTKPVGHYLPDFKNTCWENISLGDVMHQRCGLDVEENNAGVDGHPVTDFYAVGLGGGDGTGRSHRDVMKTVKVLEPPGTQYRYSSMNTQMVYMVGEEVSKEPFHESVADRIWQKVGAEADMLVGLTSGNEPIAHGMVSSTLRDFARYGILHTPSWNAVAAEPVVPKGYFKNVYAQSKPEVFRGSYLSDRMVDDFEETDIGASYQWDCVFSDGDLYKSGRGGQWLYISPATDTVVVAFSVTYKSEIWLHRYAREIVKQLFRK